jgi:hypothetical protein
VTPVATAEEQDMRLLTCLYIRGVYIRGVYIRGVYIRGVAKRLQEWARKPLLSSGG